jgi:2,3-bisphosphoglycerate-independent phosphoglycerate mutase
MLKYNFFFLAECSAKLVDLALESGKIYEGEGFKYIKECFENGTLHLIGLLSDGGVHSRLDQLQVGFIVEDSNFFLINLYAGWPSKLYTFFPICIFPVQLLLKGASERGAKRIRVHILTDGRDVLDGSSIGFLETLENDLAKLCEKGVDAQIASGGGRMYVTMDRYEVWNSRDARPVIVIILCFLFVDYLVIVLVS